MATVFEYITSNGFNKNILLTYQGEEIDMSKFGMGFFPGNEILNPPKLANEEEVPSDDGEEEVPKD